MSTTHPSHIAPLEIERLLPLLHKPAEEPYSSNQRELAARHIEALYAFWKDKHR